MSARASYEECLDVFRRLHKRDQSNSSYQVSLVIVLSEIGEIAESGGDATRAVAAYREWLDLLDQRRTADPQNSNWDVERVPPLFRLARVGDNPRERLVLARAILDRAKAAGTLTPTRQNWVAQVNRALVALPPAVTDEPVALQPGPE